jgi:hypothetical protein
MFMPVIFSAKKTTPTALSAEKPLSAAEATGLTHPDFAQKVH